MSSKSKRFLAASYLYSVACRYDLRQFSGVVKSVKQGNLLGLNAAMEENEKFFIGCGIFLILERLKIITYRWADGAGVLLAFE